MAELLVQHFLSERSVRFLGYLIFPNTQRGRLCFITPDHRWGSEAQKGRMTCPQRQPTPVFLHTTTLLVSFCWPRLTLTKQRLLNAGSLHPFGDCKVLWLYLLSPTSAQKPSPCSISWFSKIHEESHVLSSCLKTHLAGTDKSPEIPVLKPELPPCSFVVMEMARLGARWLVSREHKNSLSSIQGLLSLFRLLRK